MELERRKLGADLNATYHAFVKGLDDNLKSKIYVVRLTKKAQGTGGYGYKFGWPDVVCVAKDVTAGL